MADKFCRLEARQCDKLLKERRFAVEEFVGTWILKQRGWGENDRPVVKVHFEDEEGISYPPGRTASDFLP